MRPVVKSALRRVWRDPTTLQIGLRPEQSLVVGGLTKPAARLVDALDGLHDELGLRAAARGLGLDETVADRLIDLLGGAAVLDDAAADATVLRRIDYAERDRLAPDLAAMSVVSRRPDGGLPLLERRLASRVAVVGAGRVGTTTATLLAAAGIGHVDVQDSGPCAPADCAPGAASLADVGLARAQAARTAIRRVSPATRLTRLECTAALDVAVLVPGTAPDQQTTQGLMRSGVPHLLVGVREVTGVIGPFVVPGTSACMRCLDLHKVDRDPAWPAIAAQLAADAHRPRRDPSDACDVVLATLVASVATLQVLDHLEGRRPATFDGTLEVTLPDWRMRRRSWAPHPGCGCRWAVDHRRPASSATMAP